MQCHYHQCYHSHLYHQHLPHHWHHRQCSVTTINATILTSIFNTFLTTDIIVNAVSLPSMLLFSPLSPTIILVTGIHHHHHCSATTIATSGLPPPSSSFDKKKTTTTNYFISRITVIDIALLPDLPLLLYNHLLHNHYCSTHIQSHCPILASRRIAISIIAHQPLPRPTSAVLYFYHHCQTPLSWSLLTHLPNSPFIPGNGAHCIRMQNYHWEWDIENLELVNAMVVRS